MRPRSPMGRAIRAARIARAMTQRAAADAAGLHPVAWGRIERGQDTPRADTVARIARALGVPVGSLFAADAEGDEPTGYEVWRGASLIDGAPIVVIVTVRTSNRKTGAMLQAWIIRQDIDPVAAVRSGDDAAICGACVHRGDKRAGRGRSCYVNVGQAPLAVFRAWRRGRYPVATLADVVAWHPVPLRIGAYGDPGAVPAAVWSAAAAVPRTGYTHQWRTRPDLRALCMASVDSVAEAAEAAAQGWRAFLVVPDDAAMPFTLPGEQGTRRVVPCPAVTFGVQCAECRICDGAAAEGPGMRKPHVAIAAHGSGAAHFAPLQPGNP